VLLIVVEVEFDDLMLLDDIDLGILNSFVDMISK
jgi:hypothetical protein